MPKKNKPEKPASIKALTSEKTRALDPADSAETAGERMREHQADTWPVAKDRELVGMITEKNPDWKVGGQGHDPKQLRVGDIMNRDLVFCHEDEDCAEVWKKMTDRGMNYLPVVDREMKIIGIFTRDEIASKVEASESAED